MATIRIKDLLIRTYIGFNPEELINKQDVLINIKIEVDVPESALQTDEPDGIYDYKKVTKQIIQFVQDGRFKLLEVLTRKILDIIMEDPKIISAQITLEKFGVLPGAASVLVQMSADRSEPGSGSSLRCC